MSKTKKLTVLHANDFHGQISFKIEKDYTLVGGVSLLSGYIKKVRREEDAVFCAICGDILQDNIQNACSKGINTEKPDSSKSDKKYCHNSLSFCHNAEWNMYCRGKFPD